ncbi:MAG: VOC family protein [Anaerolineae bacterium]|nr:VOC family protein [Anaerolineae bacterium]
MQIERLDHLVMTVANIEATCAFYALVMGMQVVTFGPGRKALAFGEQKINLHERGKEFEPKALVPTPGSADLCFIASTPMSEVIRHLAEEHIEIILGPVKRTGAIGQLESVYFRDPDGNLIEVSTFNKQQ